VRTPSREGYTKQAKKEICKHFANEMLIGGSRSEGPLWVKSRLFFWGDFVLVNVQGPWRLIDFLIYG